MSSVLAELAAFDQLPVSLWMSHGADANYKVVYWNQGAQEIYGYTPEYAVGRSYLDLIVEQDARSQSMIDCDRVISGEFEHPANCIAIDHNRRYQEVVVLTNVFRYRHHKQFYQAEIGVDLTRSDFLAVIDDEYRARRLGSEHMSERTLQAWVHHARNALDENRQQWTRTFAHEIRAHLSIINNALREIDLNAPGILGTPNYAELSYSSQQLHLLSENFLRSQADRFTVKPHSPAPGYVHQAIESVEKEYSYMVAKSGLQFDVDINADARNVPLLGTFEPFRHTLRILVSNAFRHTDFELANTLGHPNIAIRVRKRRNRIIVWVDNVAMVDDPDGQITIGPLGYDGEETEGLHLGLAIAERWVHSVGGSISVRQHDGEHVRAEVQWPFPLSTQSGF